jgi:hypothetical protein
MQIAGNELGLEPVQPAQVVDGVLECAARFDGIEVSDVLAKVDVAAGRYRHRVLHVGPHREHARQRSRDTNRQRRIAARPAQHHLAAARDAHDRIVAGSRDGTRVRDEHVRDPPEPRVRIVFSGHDGIAAEVAAGRDHRVRELAH